ncbi:MAG: GspE/PulE family protein [Planctomycetota bacterium]|nr:GspE/PulE family protein [Planctomycetota bacterium]MSR38019.1 type II/IV secretion system protein [Planctomycetota bacterium]
MSRLLLEGGVLDADRLKKAEGAAQQRGQTLERAIVALGLAEENAVWRCLAKAYGLKFVDPAKLQIAPEAAKKLPIDQIEQNEALPVLLKDGVLWVAIDDPLKTFVADNLAFLAGCRVQCALMPPAALKDQIRKLRGGAVPTTGAFGKGGKGVAEDGEDAPIIRLVQKTLDEALDQRASDVHVEPFHTRLRIRYRIDGVLKEIASLDAGLLAPLTSRLKIMAGLDIAEKRKPQDGRISIKSRGRDIDVRTSVLPGSHGETIVMRLLDKERGLMSLEALGFDGVDRDRFERVIARPNGIVLVTGPTGSGKTTTLYAALQQLNRPDVKIITAEDPVEFNLRGINQCQVKARIGLSFARILRAMLRQAPNVILVGEIRDRETAEIAVQAALTGHLVFSTLHTNDAPSAITRLCDMGVKPFLVAASVQAVLAQRLVRVVCKECREPMVPSDVELRSIGIDPAGMPANTTIYRAVGCQSCEHTGYRGRIGIYEMMAMDEGLREMTFRGEPMVRLREYAFHSAGMSTLSQDGARKVMSGRTTIQELLRVTAAV